MIEYQFVKLRRTSEKLKLSKQAEVPEKYSARPGAVVHACNPSYSRGRDWADCGLWPAQAKS
jgi:hypothetical protein